MHSAQAIFLAALFVGLFLLILGNYLTRRSWRSDLQSYSRQPPSVRACDVPLHPERYTDPQTARAARIRNRAGFAFLAAALAALLYGITRAT